MVALKDSNRDFPVGKGLAVVKWKLGSTNEAIVPLASEFGASSFVGSWGFVG